MADLLSRIRSRALAKQDSPLLEQHPELEGLQPILRVSSEDGVGGSGEFQRNAGDYQRHVWVHKAIQIVANNLKKLPLEIVRGTGKAEKVITSGHPLEELLAFPNPSLSSSELWEAWVVDMYLAGEEGLEAVWTKDRSRILELWPRQESVFSVRVAPGGTRYRRIVGYRISDFQGAPYILRPDEFIHSKFYNPLSPFRGLSVIGAVRMGIIIDVLAQAWSRSFFSNSARPDFAVLTDEGITTKQKTEIEEKIMAEHGGIEGSHRPLVLEQGIKDVKAISWQPKDMEWVNQRELARDEIAAIVGVPDEIMGFGKDTYENFRTALEVLFRLTVVPLAEFRDDVLTKFFRSPRVELVRLDERIRTDFSGISELKEDEAKLFETAGKAWALGIPLENLNDRFSLGLDVDKIPGSDVGYIPFSVTPISPDTGEPVPPPSSAPPSPPAPAGTPPPAEGEPIPPEGLAGRPVRGRERAWRYGRGAPPFGSEAHVETLKRFSRIADRFVPEIRRKLKKYLQRQQNDVSRKLRDSKSFGRGLLKDPDRKPPVGEIFDLPGEIEKLRGELGPDVLRTLAAAAEDEIARLRIDISFDVERPETVAAYRELLSAVATKTNETTWEDLTDLFAEAEAAGEGIPDILERLSAYYGDRKSSWQLERTARTTTTGAANAGSLEAWRQSEVVEGGEWVSALDDRTRTPDKGDEFDHVHAHGETVRLGELYLRTGEPLAYPGDPNGSAGNIINCRCTQAPVVIEEE